MKGSLDAPVIGIIVVLVVVLGIIAPLKFFRAPLIQVIQYQEKHDNSQMILISLLSSTKDGKTVHELLGEHFVFGSPNDNELEQILMEKLDKLVESKCYKLSTPSEVLAETLDCNPDEYQKETFISLPYNPDKLTEKLILVIN